MLLCTEQVGGQTESEVSREGWDKMGTANDHAYITCPFIHPPFTPNVIV